MALMQINPELTRRVKYSDKQRQACGKCEHNNSLAFMRFDAKNYMQLGIKKEFSLIGKLPPTCKACMDKNTRIKFKAKEQEEGQK